MKAIAIITARGGSKRIFKKNIKEFCGKPIIEYSIRAALDSGVFDEVMVSTDDFQIAEIATKCGAKVPFFRSQKTSNDYATTYDVIEEVLDKYKENGKNFKYACCIYPTAPFITADKLLHAFSILNTQNVEGVVPIVKFSFPPQRAFIKDEFGIKYQYPKCANTRSQDLEEIYHDCGQFYFFDVNAFYAQKKMIMERCYGLVMPEEEVQDIDTMSDWKIAELKYQLFRENLKK